MLNGRLKKPLQILSAASARRWYPYSFSREASSSDTAGDQDRSAGSGFSHEASSSNTAGGEIPVVVGIAGSRTEAEEILVQMTEESLQI